MSELQRSDPPSRLRHPPVSSASGSCRVGFLYIHEADHQVAHSASIARELARSHPGIDVCILTASDTARDMVYGFLKETAQKCRFAALRQLQWQKPLALVLDKFFPFSRVINLVFNRGLLASFDALVVPERTSLALRLLLLRRCPLLIHTKHGSGDRSQGLKPSESHFDFILLSGRKLQERLEKAGYLRPGQSAIVGYPKFDAVDVLARPHAKLFRNGRPVVVYNPHPDAYLSSWYTMGSAVLEYFYNSTEYDLIFAPHIMLFRKWIHVSNERARLRMRRRFPAKYLNCPHIRVDLQSKALTDMTYMLNADIYLGDVSSQVYEFLLHPRPCVFLNSHQARWRGNPDYLAWTLGPVISDVGELHAALRRAVDEHAMFRPLQERAVRRTFSFSDIPASARAADAISAFLRGRKASCGGPGTQGLEQAKASA